MIDYNALAEAGLYARIDELAGKNQALEEQNEGLRDRVEELEELLREFREGDAEYYKITERLTDERDEAIRDGEKFRDRLDQVHSREVRANNQINNLRHAVEQARSDLEGLQHVPFHDLDASINDIRKALGDVL